MKTDHKNFELFVELNLKNQSRSIFCHLSKQNLQSFSCVSILGVRMGSEQSHHQADPRGDFRPGVGGGGSFGGGHGGSGDFPPMSPTLRSQDGGTISPSNQESVCSDSEVPYVSYTGYVLSSTFSIRWKVEHFCNNFFDPFSQQTHQ